MLTNTTTMDVGSTRATATKQLWSLTDQWGVPKSAVFKMVMSMRVNVMKCHSRHKRLNTAILPLNDPRPLGPLRTCIEIRCGESYFCSIDLRTWLLLRGAIDVSHMLTLILFFSFPNSRFTPSLLLILGPRAAPRVLGLPLHHSL